MLSKAVIDTDEELYELFLANVGASQKNHTAAYVEKMWDVWGWMRDHLEQKQCHASIRKIADYAGNTSPGSTYDMLTDMADLGLVNRVRGGSMREGGFVPVGALLLTRHVGEIDYDSPVKRSH